MGVLALATKRKLKGVKSEDVIGNEWIVLADYVD